MERPDKEFKMEPVCYSPDQIMWMNIGKSSVLKRLILLCIIAFVFVITILSLSAFESGYMERKFENYAQNKFSESYFTCRVDITFEEAKASASQQNLEDGNVLCYCR